MTDKTPEATSSDYEAMAPYWRMVSAILGGTETMRAGGQTYLPKFEHESKACYDTRLASAKFTNIFSDIVDTLASKPFEKELVIEKSDAVDDLIEDIDGQGNHIHVFGAGMFHSGVSDAITWALIDYTADVPQGATRAAEQALGARPYWVNIPASNMLAVYSETIGGREVITHARYREDAKERDGFDEVVRKRVRVLQREVVYDETGKAMSAGAATWELYEKQKDATDAKEKWVSISSGVYSIGIIPLVPFITGRRLGSSWVIRPALQSAAHLQIEHYQQESELKYMRQRTAFAMLAGNGVEPATDEQGNPKPVPTGPFSVLYAPPGSDGKNGSWEILEPSGSSLEFCSKEVDKTEAQLRELGRQPLTAQSGNITTITAAFAGDKAHTVIEAWALNFKDFLENCLKITTMWRGSQIEPEVQVNTDFALSLREDTGASNLDAARGRGDISHETWFDEMKRRGIIGPNRTFEEENKRLIEEMPGDPTANDLADALTA